MSPDMIQLPSLAMQILLLFPESDNVALHPFDQASAVACDGTRISQDVCLNPLTNLLGRERLQSGVRWIA